MKWSRRGFVAGLAAAGAVAVPVGSYYAYRQAQAEQEAELSSDEPATPVAHLEEALLAERLVGVWDVTLAPGAAALPGLHLEGAPLLLDAGPNARAVRGQWGECQVFGQLDAQQAPRLTLALANAGGKRWHCEAVFDEIWQWQSGGGRAGLSGQVRPSGAQAGYSGAVMAFVAVRRAFTPAHERLPFVPALHAHLVAPGMRLFHQVWHASRDRWHRLDSSRRQAVRALGWQSGPLGAERDARGKHRHTNGSGEDFLFMHRHMLGQARRHQPLPSWPSLPLPRPALQHGAAAFQAYVLNEDGFSVPPAWAAEGDEAFNRWLHYIKSSDGLYANFQLWEARYRDPDYLATLCLGELGSRIELGIHDWLHMRWAGLPRDPTSGLPMPYARRPDDFAPRWFDPGNDYLGDPFSSHVNPVFWRFHGWIDDRIEDWFLAHDRAHPGEVARLDVGGVPWFAPGPWVKVASPWLGPTEHGCGAWGESNLRNDGAYDLETMKLVAQVIFGADEAFERLQPRLPRRPWYARHLAPGADRI